MKYDSKNAQYECSIVRKYEYCQFFSNLADFDNFCFLNEMVSIWTRVQWSDKRGLAVIGKIGDFNEKYFRQLFYAN